MKHKTLLTAALAGVLLLSAVPVTVCAEETVIAGDVDADGVLGTSDVVLLQKWLLAAPDTALTSAAADLNADGSIDVFDLSLLKRELIGSVTTPVETEMQLTVNFTGEAVEITDADGNAVAEQSAVKIDGQIVTFTQPGEYIVLGTSENGQIVVDVDKTAYPAGKVTLSLQGLTLSNPTAAPLYVAGVGDECIISAKKGTVNTLSDGAAHTDSYTDSDGEEKAISSVIYSRDDIKFKGKGTLIVNGSAEDGIVCTNDIKIYNSTIEVNAADDGIRGKDSVRIGDPDATAFDDLRLTVNAANGDGIKVTNANDEKKGYVEINGGTVSVTANADGIQAAREIIVNGGEISITVNEGSQYDAPTLSGLISE